MRKAIYFLAILTMLATAACSTKTLDDALIVPPNFSEIPDPNNPEKPSQQQKNADLAKLKDLLLKSE